MTTTDVATLKPYEEPFYEKRVWDLTEFEDWERELLAAVKTGGVHALEHEIAQLENPENRDAPKDIWKPYGKSRAWALDRHDDIIREGTEPAGDGKLKVKDSTRLREWRNWRSLRFVRFSPADTQPMLDSLETIEHDALEALRWADLLYSDELADPFRRYGIHEWRLPEWAES